MAGMTPFGLLAFVAVPVLYGAPPGPKVVAPPPRRPPAMTAPSPPRRPPAVVPAAARGTATTRSKGSPANAPVAESASEIAAETPTARAARWTELAASIHPERWSSPRIEVWSGDVTEPVRMSGTTASRTYHEAAVDHPLTARFTFAETWKGPLRKAATINLLIRERGAGTVVAEIASSGNDTRLVTAGATRTFKTQREALQAFFQGQPGFAKASREAQANASPVSYEYYSLHQHMTTTARAGILRPALGDPSTLVYQDSGVDAEVQVRRLDLGKLPRSVTLAPGEILAVPGRASLPDDSRWNRTPLLTKIGDAAVPGSKAWPAYTLFRLPDHHEDATSFDVFVTGEDGRARTIRVEPAR